jgi:uncharacterized protein YegL
VATRAHITLIVDRSGSMASIRDEAEEGIKMFIRDQAALDGVKVKVSLYQFDNKYEKVFGPVKAGEAPGYTLMPRSMTALYDAIGKGIEDTERTIADADKRPDKVVVVIMTDGFENASQEHTFKSVSALIEEQKKAGWEFIFLAGTLESVKFGQAAGLHTTGYDPGIVGQTRAVYATASGLASTHLTGQPPVDQDESSTAPSK